MEWLGEWLRDVVVIILVATFMDLVLPGQSMQRYVRVVIGLFILLALLAPVATLLRLEIRPEQLLGEAPAAQSGASLEEILRSGEELRAMRDQESRNLLRERAEDVLKDEIEARFAVRVEEVEVMLTEHPDEPGIESVQLTVSDPGKNQEDDETGDRREISVEPVKPVHIDVRIGRGQPVSAYREPTNERTPEQKALERELAEWLASEWGIPGQGIRIRFDAED